MNLSKAHFLVALSLLAANVRFFTDRADDHVLLPQSKSMYDTQMIVHKQKFIGPLNPGLFMKSF